MSVPTVEISPPPCVLPTCANITIWTSTCYACPPTKPSTSRSRHFCRHRPILHENKNFTEVLECWACGAWQTCRFRRWSMIAYRNEEECIKKKCYNCGMRRDSSWTEVGWGPVYQLGWVADMGKWIVEDSARLMGMRRRLWAERSLRSRWA